MRGKLVIKGEEFPVTFKESETTAHLIYEYFPLEMNMKDINDMEKYFFLPNEIPFNKQQRESIEPGEILLYGNDCVCIFYKGTKTHYKYTPIGQVDNPIRLEELLGYEDAHVLFLLD